jgi:hypothetical protein
MAGYKPRSFHFKGNIYGTVQDVPVEQHPQPIIYRTDCLQILFPEHALDLVATEQP